MRFVRQNIPLLGILLAASSWTALAAGQDPALRKYHPWAYFNEGSWAKVRVVTQTFDASGRLVSSGMMETRTVLQAVEQDSVTLLVENTVEIGGKRLASQPQIVKQGYSGEQVGQNVAIKNLGAAQVTIDGKQIACQMQEVEVMAEGRRRSTLVHFSDAVAPYILRRKSVLSDPAGNQAANEVDVEVIALDMPTKVLSEIHPAAHVKVVQKNDHGTTVTLSVNATDIPGEVISHSSKSVDSQGHVVRRSTLEVVGYHIASETTDGPMRFRHRRRDRR